jgi:hypothetical protein
MIPDILRDSDIPLGGRPDAQAPQQRGRGLARISRLAQDRMKTLVSQVLED